MDPRRNVMAPPVGGLGSSVLPAGAASLRTGGPSNEKTKERKSVRLKLDLFETSANRYPEFNYSKLVHLEKKKMKLIKQKTNGFLPDVEDGNSEVARIARELEKKYGSGYGRSRGRSKKDDQCDIGMGYDETDSFIDNTEAYDEIIPEEVEPAEGGFYINCGALEFTSLTTEWTTNKTDEIIKMPNKSRKRILSSSEDSSSSEDDEEDDDEEDEDDDDEDNDSGEESAEENSRAPKNTSNGFAEKRFKPVAKSEIRKAQETDNKKDKTIVISSSSSDSPKRIADDIGSDSDKDRVRQKSIKTTTVKDMLKAKRDSFLKSQGGASSSATAEANGVNGEVKIAVSKTRDDDSSSEDSENSSESSESEDQSVEQDQKLKKSTNDEKTEKLRSSDTKLPSLDSDVTTSIVEFKDVVKSKNLIGKKFQLDDTLAEVFLKIDEALLCIEKPQRNMVFAHLEYHLLLPKYYFLRKAKQLRIKEEKQKSQRVLSKLRKAVIEAMPGVIASYEVEMRKYRELLAANANSDHPPKEPKKRFPWNSAMRNFLYEVYQVRWTSYPVLGTRKQTLEEFITGYLRDKIVDIWPNGWMRLEELQREIEKRKAATKKDKDKEKKRENSASTNTASANVQMNLPTDAYGKQFDDHVVNRSNANSDTDSTHSTGKVAYGKRRNTDSSKSRNKIQKPNGEQQSGPNTITTTDINKKSQTQSHVPVGGSMATPDSFSSLKRTEPSIQNAAISKSPTPLPSHPQVQPQQKHSNSAIPKAAHIIDLDQYRSTSDILQTSKQILDAAAAASSQLIDLGFGVPTHVIDANQQDSSSESDCVEIVDVFPAKPSPPSMKLAKSKKPNSNSYQSSQITVPSNFKVEPNTGMYASTVSMSNMPSSLSSSVSLLKNPLNMSSGSSTSNHNNNNNNNTNNSNNNNNNGNKRCINGPKLPNFDMAKAIKELEDLPNFQKNVISSLQKPPNND